MASVPSRDLRNHTAEVLARVAAGERLVVTVRGEAVAELTPPPDRRPAFLSRAELLRIPQTDPGLRETLRELDELLDDDLGIE